MAAAVLLVLALWAPVALVGGLAGRAAEPRLSGVERLALGVALALTLVGWVSLVLATLGLFAGPTLLGALAAAGVATTVWALRQRARGKRPRASGAGARPARPDVGFALWLLACGALAPKGLMGRWRDRPRAFHAPAWRGAAPLRRARVVAGSMRRHAELLALGVMLVGAAALYQPPFPFILGGLDPGVYVNTAAHIARTGSLIWHDADMVALPPDLRAVLFREPAQMFTDGSRYIGLYIADRDAGVVVPHGLHLYPALMAALWWAGGLDLALRAGALAALAGLAALYACARRLGGWRAALLATAMLAGSIGQSWFARFPSAEPLAQAQVWGGLLALLVALRGGGRLLPLVGGALLGSAHLTKVELVAVPVVLAAFLAWRWLAGRWMPALGWYAAGYGVLALHAALHAALVAPWYTLTALGLIRVPGHLVLSAIMALGMVAVALWTGRAWLRRVVAWVERRQRAFGAVLAVLLVVVAAWAYVVRPLGSEALGAYEANNRQSLVRLGWYTGPPVVPLAVSGLALALVAGGPGLLFAALAALEGLLHLSDARITPQHFWAARRLMVVLVPAAVLFAALAMARLWPVGGGWLTSPSRFPAPPAETGIAAARVEGGCSSADASGCPREAGTPRGSLDGRAAWLRAALVVALLVWIGWHDVTAAAPFVGHVEYAGAREDLAALAALVPADRVVLYEWSDESWRLALPLHLQLGVRGFLVPPEALVDPRLPALLGYLATSPSPPDGPARPAVEGPRSDMVYWLSAGGSLDWLPAGFRAVHVATRVLVWPEAQRSSDRLPWRTERYIAVVDLYGIVPAPGAARTPGPVLDVGGADGCCVSGFGPPTQVAGCAACRWLGGRGVLDVPVPAGSGRRELVLALTAGPEQQEERWAEVWVQDTLAGRVPLGRGFRTYYLPLGEIAAPAVRIVLRPADTSGGMLAVDWARIDLVRTDDQ